ncbi:integrase core domain-containing protein [uncultured Algoriphagus sp.]|uniref:integrase core domain-containing protein n=1 Tax=uncultured Algoriphagus sp. TaxID=417365 RepID=UPI0030EEB065
MQYCCDDYQLALRKNHITSSMTEQYDPSQNAVAERVNGILKQEFIRGISIEDLTLMRKLIRQSIHIYNHERPHWGCWLHTPNTMHKQEKIKIRTYKTKNSTEEQPDAI